MATVNQPVTYLAPSEPISMQIVGDTPSQLAMTTGGAGGAVASVNGSVGAVTLPYMPGQSLSDSGLIAATVDFASASNSGAAIVTGTVFFGLLTVWQAALVTNILTACGTLTNAPTAAYLGLYNMQGQQVLVTADLHAQSGFATGNNLITGLVTAGPTPVPAADYWAALLTVGTSPSVVVARPANSAISGAITNAGRSAAAGNLKAATYSLTGQSVLPASFNPVTQMNSISSFYAFALS